MSLLVILYSLHVWCEHPLLGVSAFIECVCWPVRSPVVRRTCVHKHTNAWLFFFFCWPISTSVYFTVVREQNRFCRFSFTNRLAMCLVANCQTESNVSAVHSHSPCTCTRTQSTQRRHVSTSHMIEWLSTNKLTFGRIHNPERPHKYVLFNNEKKKMRKGDVMALVTYTHNRLHRQTAWFVRPTDCSVQTYTHRTRIYTFYTRLEFNSPAHKVCTSCVYAHFVDSFLLHTKNVRSRRRRQTHIFAVSAVRLWLRKSAAERWNEETLKMFFFPVVLPPIVLW